VHRAVAKRSKRLRNLSRFSELTKLRTDSTVVCRDPTRNAEVEKPLRFQSRQSSGGTTSLEYRREPRIQASQER
jgi:hypothetical protein